MFRSLAFVALFLTACTAPRSGGGGSGTPPTPQSVALSGSYALIALNGQSVGPGITLDLADDGSFSGQAPCNRYFGGYTAQSDFSFGFSQIGATRAACPQLQLESAYLGALGTATQYRADDGPIISDQQRLYA
jgi:heat shock protein HslJ